MTEHVYIGTYSKRGSRGIYRARQQRETGTLQLCEAYAAQNPSYLCQSVDGRMLYTTLECASLDGQYGSAVQAYAIHDNGRLAMQVQRRTFGAAACHLSVCPQNRRLFVANYTEGTLSVYPLDAQGLPGWPMRLLVHEGRGSDPVRQQKAHAHFALPTPDGRNLCVADLGIDQVLFYAMDDDSLALRAHIDLPAGSGPRHAAFTPGGRFMYIVNELACTVACVRLDTLQITGIWPTLPDGYTAPNTCAAIRVSPDGKCLYASNRGHDSVAHYSIDAASGALVLQAITPVQGRTPRDIALSPDGAFLYAACEDSDCVTVFAVGRAGALSPAGEPLRVPAPVCILFAQPPA